MKTHFLATGLLLVSVGSTCVAGTQQDEIYGDGFDGFDHPPCDSGLASDSGAASDYVAAMDVCSTTTAQGMSPGLISATFTLPSGSGTPSAQSYSIRSAFGSGNTPRAGSAMVVLSTGAAAAPGQSNPSFVAFEPGDDTGTSSAAPSDWLAANGGVFPVAPACTAALSNTAYNPVMLTLQIRVPSNARSFSLAANFFSSDFPEYVCSQYNDLFVALLDSTFSGTPANPSDKNIATYFAPDSNIYPLNVNLAYAGLLTQCVNGSIGCLSGHPGIINTCVSTVGLAGTGMDFPDPAPASCDATSLVGGGTDWLTIRGNVVPGEVIQLRLALWDTADGTYDSVILLDNFQWSSATTTPGISRN